jgi:hypothetical protein
MEHENEHRKTDPRRAEASGSETVAILTNVSWIVEQLDGRGLREIGDVPVLELAKHICISGRTAA